ncbi:transglutaminase-like domain-containing protein [Tengunoibacter tsumagoiensis]|uniref:Transglutaminase n=1 Tax=Tengunoibacter tsumagoiensis TaxID=2014871 RepID=A0A402A6D3_9CHLR|nr:transglutaminase family protein [Tengunoibacter tsumagoiensis]GCE14694.1 transglutaminase [Tengunoibacter tsumagoiensis]
MQIRVGCEFRYEATWPTPTILQVQPHPDGPLQVLHETWQLTPSVSMHGYRDMYANQCQRLVMPVGEHVWSYDAVVEVADGTDEYAPDAIQHPVESLPDEVLVYLLPSRFCLSDVLSNRAWELFGQTQPGWSRVQAICDWVHTNIRFQYGTSRPTTTAVDVCEQGVGVCRDFTHLGVTFCRAMNIPARYVFGYIPDIGVPIADAPMDFCAWMEVYLSNRWWTFDPRNNIPRTGRVLVGRGRDALDVAMVTTYGSPGLTQMTVWADDARNPDILKVPMISSDSVREDKANA